MGRTVKTRNITTREARSRLPRNHANPFWHPLRTSAPQLHLGLRKGKHSSAWTARLYAKNSETGLSEYVYLDLNARPDDSEAANGDDVLSFDQAQERARKLADDHLRRPADMPKGPFTVGQVCLSYVEHMKAEGKTSWRDALVRIKSKIICAPMRKGGPHKKKGVTVERQKKPELVLGPILGNELTTAMLRKWLTTLPRERNRIMPEGVKGPSPEELERRSKATANRTLAVLKAALNYGFAEGMIEDDKVWKRVKPFRKVNASRQLFLSEEEVQSLIEACPPDLAQLVRGGVYTGARYGELAAMRVRDFNPKVPAVFVEAGKTEHSRWVDLSDEGKHFFEEQTQGRDSEDHMFLRDDASEESGKRDWRSSDQTRPFKLAAAKAQLPVGLTFYALRHTYASAQINRGTELFVIAKALGHTDTRMVEKHYGHLAQSYVRSRLRANAPSYGFKKKSDAQTVATASGVH